MATRWNKRLELVSSMVQSVLCGLIADAIFVESYLSCNVIKWAQYITTIESKNDWQEDTVEIELIKFIIYLELYKRLVAL